ncbi:hypothetical protein ACFE04_022890 [Oxalis oulophora]
MTIINISTLEAKYIDLCEGIGVLPNQGVLSALFKARAKKSRNEVCDLELSLDYLKDEDIHPLLQISADINVSEIEAIDIQNDCSCVLSGENALSFMREVSQKLRVVDLQDWPFGKDFLRDISQTGLSCQVLNIRCSQFSKLNLVGNFIQLHTLNFDFSSSLSSFREDCFTCMPNLKILSLCETKIANIWTTVAAISKLPSLEELRFQTWISYDDTIFWRHKTVPGIVASSSINNEEQDYNLSTEECFGNLSPTDTPINIHEIYEDLSEDSNMDHMSSIQEYDFPELSTDAFSGWSLDDWIWQDEVSSETLNQNKDESPTGNYTSCNASPICLEKHYREFMITSLPKLKILDNLPIKDIDRELAATTFSNYFEFLPYRRKHKVSVTSILQGREIKASHRNFRCTIKSQDFYTRSLCAAKVGSAAWPLLQPLTISGNTNESRKFRPRQFEYHPSNSSLMVFGTLDGEIVVVNHENGKVVSYVPSLGAMNCVLGLCWLKRHPSKVIAGSDNGTLKLYDIQQTPPTAMGMFGVTFDDFDHLTSVHVNATDELFLASGYSKDVALYDIGSGRRLHMFTDMHREHINVVKFSNHSPSIFATSSFDQEVKLWDLRQKPVQPCYTSLSSKGNVMVCFSPDDSYLLVSAVDNEVRQIQAVDGRPHLNFEIAPTGSFQNYTRSYYMNGRDYIISGSCDEQIVRICCAQTGKRLKDVYLEGKDTASMFVQSLRGDPVRDFNLSVLAAYTRPSSKSEIVKVNLLKSSSNTKEYSKDKQSCPLKSLGG